jgi:hypothetical protein
MSRSARAWFVAAVAALALCATRCALDVPLGVAPADAGLTADADAGAG